MFRFRTSPNSEKRVYMGIRNGAYRDEIWPKKPNSQVLEIPRKPMTLLEKSDTCIMLRSERLERANAQSGQSPSKWLALWETLWLFHNPRDGQFHSHSIFASLYRQPTSVRIPPKDFNSFIIFVPCDNLPDSSQIFLEGTYCSKWLFFFLLLRNEAKTQLAGPSSDSIHSLDSLSISWVTLMFSFLNSLIVAWWKAFDTFRST